MTEKWNPSPALMSSESVEWYTPKHIIDAVIEVLGRIDIDPCAEPQKAVPALIHYTEKENGLIQEWNGKVYMNPPYGRVINEWIDKLISEYKTGRTTEAIALVPGRIETKWFRRLQAKYVCNIKGRLSFTENGNSAPFPSVAIYIGPNPQKFIQVFSRLGDVYERKNDAIL